MIKGLSVTEYDLEVANNEGDPYDEAEYLLNQIKTEGDKIRSNGHYSSFIFKAERIKAAIKKSPILK